MEIVATPVRDIYGGNPLPYWIHSTNLQPMSKDQVWDLIDAEPSILTSPHPKTRQSILQKALLDRAPVAVGEIIKAMKGKGILDNIMTRRDRDGQTPLFSAIRAHRDGKEPGDASLPCQYYRDLVTPGTLSVKEPSEGLTPILFAMKYNKAGVLRHLLRKDLESCHFLAQDGKGYGLLHHCFTTDTWSALILAEQQGVHGLVQQAMALRDEDGRTPLMIWVLKGWEGVAQNMMEWCKENNLLHEQLGMKDVHGDSVVHMAAEHPWAWWIFEKFLQGEEGKALLGMTNERRETILHVAARGRDQKVAEDIIYKSVDLLTKQDTRGCTALAVAVKGQSPMLVKTIMRCAGKYLKELVCSQDYRGLNPLHEAFIGRIKANSACITGNGKSLEIIEMIFAEEEKLGLLTKERGMLWDVHGMAYTHTAAAAGDVEALEVIHKWRGEGAFEFVDAQGRNTLHVAASNGHGEVVGEYLRKQPNFPTLHRHKDKQGRLPEIHGKKGTSTSTTTLATTASSTSEDAPSPHDTLSGVSEYNRRHYVAHRSFIHSKSSSIIADDDSSTTGSTSSSDEEDEDEKDSFLIKSPVGVVTNFDSIRPRSQEEKKGEMLLPGKTWGFNSKVLDASDGSVGTSGSTNLPAWVVTTQTHI